MKRHILATSAILAVLAGCTSTAPSGTTVARLQKAERVRPEEAPADEPAPKAPAASEGQITNRPRAQVNNTFILDDEVRKSFTMMKLSGGRGSDTEIFKSVLERLIDREVVLDEVFRKIKPEMIEKLKAYAAKEGDKRLALMKEKMGAKSEDDLRVAIEALGLSIESIRRQEERDFMMSQYMHGRLQPLIEAQVGHRQIQEYYDDHPDEFQVEDRVKWQDIFIDPDQFKSRDGARAQAEKVAERARGGADFVKLAVEIKAAPGLGKDAEGLGQRRGEIQPREAERTLLEMKPGEVGIVELSSGFHVVRVAERDFAGTKPLDQKTQMDIRKKLQGIVGEREFKAFVLDLRRKAFIKVFEDPKE